MVHDVSQSLIGPAHTRHTQEAPARGDAPAARNASAVRGDSVELSADARAYAESLPVRQALVDRVRAEIARGNYLSDDKIDVAAERLLRDVRGA